MLHKEYFGRALGNWKNEVLMDGDIDKILKKFKKCNPINYKVDFRFPGFPISVKISDFGFLYLLKFNYRFPDFRISDFRISDFRISGFPDSDFGFPISDFY